jgi:copper transport protein
MLHRRRTGAWLWAVVLAGTLGLALWMGPAASAHALPVTTSPSAGQTLASSPTQIVMTFTETPDVRDSVMEVLDTSGKRVAGPAPGTVPGQPGTTLRIPIPTPLPKGIYTVNWKTISTVDGHLATGSFSFGVGVSPGSVTTTASTPAIKQPGPSELATVARFLYLTGLIGLLGLAFTELVVLSGADAPAAVSRRLGKGLALSWVLAFVGTLGMVQALRAGAALTLSGVLGSSIGQAFLLRVVPLLITGAGLLALRLAGRGARRRAVLGFVAAGTLVSMLADVLKSHAAGSSSWVWFRVGTQWIHFAAAGIWVGGLAGLLAALGPLGGGHRLSPTRRFSFSAGVAIVVVGITGTLRALDEVGSWKGLFHTSYGQLIIVKIVLFGILACLGALNRFRHVDAVERAPRGLYRTGTAELVAMALVLGSTGLLQNLAPAKSQLETQANPAAQAPATMMPILAEGSDFAHTYKLALTIAPGTAGFGTYTLKLDNYLTGTPVGASSVSIAFSDPNDPNLGSSDLTLARQPDGTYKATGANLSILGGWTLTVTVENGLNSVDVPLQVVTESPPQPIRVQQFAGSPTVYNVSLSGGDVLQIYLDPINLGKAEFHATFLNATGTEIQMSTNLAADTARVPGGAVTGFFPYRDLDGIGHFVADAEVPKGTYQFSVVGTTPTGTALGATLTLPVS